MKLKSLKFKSVKSTNDIAHKLIKKKKIRPTIIVSEKQTKGRGTMGKKWISKKGNLFLTIFFDISKKKLDFKKFAVLNAYLLKSILVKKFSNKIKIKWPNDLLFEGKKICGILQETVINAEKKFLIIGIGINTNLNPKSSTFSSPSFRNDRSDRLRCSNQTGLSQAQVAFGDQDGCARSDFHGGPLP